MMQALKIQPISRKTWRRSLFIPVGLLCLLTVGFWLGDWDRRFVNLLYADGEFMYKQSSILHVIYEVAAWPAILLAFVCFVYFLISLIRRRPGDLRLISLGICLSIIVGPALLVNFVFKDYYGRPRPKQVEQYGGEMEYLTVLVPGTEKYGRSFPSGHSAVGYVMLVLFLTGLSVRNPLAWWALAFAIPYGTVIGMARVLQGAHWLSDVMWSLGIIYYCTLAVLWALGIFRPEKAVQQK